MTDGVSAATPYGPRRSPEQSQKPPLAAVTEADRAARGRNAADRAGQDAAEGVSAIDARRFRSILGHFATGVVAITAIDPETGRPTGLAANSFTSVSLDPALVSFCVAHTSTTWPRLRRAERHCVNILSAPQRDVCLRFASRGGEKFAGLEWTGSPSGEPVIDGALAWLECSVEAEHVAGDHVIVVARVHHLDRHHDGDPLVFYKGSYGSFGD
jgi:3-hydroxy-9,10-secoandrosta-1,3,5(10)-triene-9,17-dione monooxygenase reductase component